MYKLYLCYSHFQGRWVINLVLSTLTSRDQHCTSQQTHAASAKTNCYNLTRVLCCIYSTPHSTAPIWQSEETVFTSASYTFKFSLKQGGRVKKTVLENTANLDGCGRRSINIWLWILYHSCSPSADQTNWPIKALQLNIYS